MTGAKRDRSLALGIGISTALVAVVLLSFVWMPYDPTAMDIPHRLLPPCFAHPFGTDPYGRDVLSIVMAGSRTTLYVALSASVLGFGVGVPLGLIAGVKGGLIDDAVMRSSDIVFAFPSLLIAVLIAAIGGAGLVSTVAAIGIFNIPVFARVARAGARGVWQRDFVLAAQVSAKTDGRIAIEHVLPNIAGLLLVQGAIQFSVAIIAEAGLSYVGLGIQPPQPSWGRMLDQAQTMLDFAPWLAVFPGAAILVTVFGFNVLGDGLRNRLDPRRELPSRELS